MGRQHRKPAKVKRKSARQNKPRIKAAGRRRKAAKRTRKLRWSPTPEAQKVIDATRDVFDNTPGAKSDCNRFVKAVCKKVLTDPFAPDATADVITNNIRDPGWRTANGWTGLEQDPVWAKNSADRGDLVIGGATSSDLGEGYGHVVVVVSCERLWRGFGYASWGKFRGIGRVNEKMTRAYKYRDLPKVSYMCKGAPSPS